MLKHALVLLLAVLPTSALADWEGKLSVKPLKKDAPAPLLDGRIFLQEGKSRTEMQGPMGISIVSISDGKKHYLLYPSQNSYSEIDPATAPEGEPRMPSCASGNFDDCIKGQGFKKSGSGEANGFDCSIYERTSEGRRGPVTSKVWHPNKAKAPAFVRFVVSQADGSGMQMDATDFKEKSLDKSLFKIPEGYTQQESMHPMAGPGGPGGKGMPSREQMEEMMKRYQEQQQQRK
jgi:hypothetical protein